MSTTQLRKWSPEELKGKSEEELLEILAGVVHEQLTCNPEEITRTANLVDDLGADSLDLVELMMAVEEVIGIEVPDEDAMLLKTVGDILDYTYDKINPEAKKDKKA